MRSTGMRLLVGLVVLAACDPETHGPRSGVITVDIAPRPAATAGLVLSTARMHLDHIGVFGDTAPPPPVDADLDALSSGLDVTFTDQPQGLYSRVRFGVSRVVINGAWRGVPLEARIDMGPGPGNMNVVDLRAPSGHEQELGPEQDVTFTVAVDVPAWFAGGLLDAAVPRDGRIVLDNTQNAEITRQLGARITRSFLLQ